MAQIDLGELHIVVDVRVIRHEHLGNQRFQTGLEDEDVHVRRPQTVTTLGAVPDTSK